jgi:hypothetical protein
VCKPSGLALQAITPIVRKPLQVGIVRCFLIVSIEQADHFVIGSEVVIERLDGEPRPGRSFAELLPQQLDEPTALSFHLAKERTLDAFSKRFRERNKGARACADFCTEDVGSLGKVVRTVFVGAVVWFRKIRGKRELIYISITFLFKKDVYLKIFLFNVPYGEHTSGQWCACHTTTYGGR